MTNYYKKLNVAQLETLLKRRGLPAGGTKTQMMGRLVMQDKEWEVEAKASEARVKAASVASSTSGGGDGSTSASKDSGVPEGADVSSRNGAKKAGKRRGKGNEASNEKGPETAMNGAPAAVNNHDAEVDQDAYIKSLIAGASNTSKRQVPGSSGIVVQMTPNEQVTKTSNTPKIYQQVSSQMAVTYAEDIDDEEEEDNDSRAAIMVVLVAVFIGMIAALGLGGFTFDDIRSYAWGMADILRDPIRSLEKVILGADGVRQNSTLESVSERVRKLWHVVSEKL